MAPRTLAHAGTGEHTRVTYVDGRPQSMVLRKCRLLVRDGSSEAEHVFDKDVITFGSMDDNDIVLRDDTVSRYHCRIFLDGDRYMVRDLESTNGTFINRVQVREAFLRPNCVLTLGKGEVRFLPFDERVRIVPAESDRFGDVIGKNLKMREVYSVLEKIAPTDTTVVIEGETGTGKEVVARSLHAASRRSEGPFMVFDCGAVPHNLIESELFGHEKGSFTGAIMTRQGIFELAGGGTLFLDELGELDIELQPKLLRALERREVKRVGSAKPIAVDVRVIAATNRNLEAEVQAGRFREDLFYRLAVVRVVLPTLRDRKDDIALLVEQVLATHPSNRKRTDGVGVKGLSPEAMGCLLRYDWPGNVRELFNVIERAVSFCESDTIDVEDLPEHIAAPRGAAPAGAPATSPDEDVPFKEAKEKWVASFEKEYIVGLLRKNNMNISHAAREADIDRKYFRKLMRKYGIPSPSDDREGP